jgi:hypothetical protein
LRDKIAQSNYETVQKMGVDELKRRLYDILRDRNESYGTLVI